MRFFDVLVAKTFDVTKEGVTEKRTQWNRVGRAWPAKTSDVLNFELFLLPGQRYTVSMKDKPPSPPTDSSQASIEDAPF